MQLLKEGPFLYSVVRTCGVFNVPSTIHNPDNTTGKVEIAESDEYLALTLDNKHTTGHKRLPKLLSVYSHHFHFHFHPPPPSSIAQLSSIVQPILLLSPASSPCRQPPTRTDSSRGHIHWITNVSDRNNRATAGRAHTTALDPSYPLNLYFILPPLVTATINKLENSLIQQKLQYNDATQQICKNIGVKDKSASLPARQPASHKVLRP